MKINGTCHCENIRFVIKWPGPNEVITARCCGCSFCQKHGGSWTSNPDGDLRVIIDDPAAVTRYRFGTMTADFHICTICGVVPLVSSEIDDQTFAVVNVNTFDNKQEFNMTVTSTDFGGEDVGSRLDRRKQNWIPAVQFEHCSN